MQCMISTTTGNERNSFTLPRRKSVQNTKKKSPGKARKGKEEALTGPPILDNRIEEIKSTLKLKRKDLIKCWNTFRQYDLENQGYFTCDSFLNRVVYEPRTLFVETVFQLGGVTKFEHMEFGSLFCAIVTFCMFEIDEMVKVVFYMFDPDKNGDINKMNMTNFLKILHNEEVLKKNIQTALQSFQVERDGTIGFLAVVHWCRRFPSVMEPAFRLQAKMREKFMGVAFWEKNLVLLKKERDCRLDIKERDREMEQRRLLRERSRRIKSELGFQYFFNKSKREHIEKLYPIPIVYISDDEIKSIKLRYFRINMTNEKRYLQKWKEVVFIYDYLAITKKKGSMENALSRSGSRYVKCIDFVISVMDEFAIQPPTIQIEKHLKRLYNAFPGSEQQKVDSCQILCTYLSIMLGESIQKNPKRVFYKFCDIYSSENDQFISVQDVLNILSLGCISFSDFEQCSEKLFSSIQVVDSSMNLVFDNLKESSLSRFTIDRVLDESPSLLIQFRDQILSNLREDKRLELLTSDEYESIGRFHKSANTFIKRRVVLKWNEVLFASFYAWIHYVKDKARNRLFLMRMLYWRAQHVIDIWRSRVRRSTKLSEFFYELNEKQNLKNLRKSFKRWILNQKIQKACLQQSHGFKLKALGFTKLRIIKFGIMKKYMFYLWLAEVQEQQKMELAIRSRRFMLIKNSFSKWKSHSYQLILKRKEAEHKVWATETIRKLQASIGDQIELKNKTQPNNNTTELKIVNIRKEFNSDLDKSIVDAQRDARKKRFEMEKKDLISNWNNRWIDIEKNRVTIVIKHTKDWLKTKEGQYQIIKFIKRTEQQLQSPPPEASNHVFINLSILDGKLAAIGMLSDAFFDMLIKISGADGLIHRESLMSCLNEIGVKMTSSQLRDIYNDSIHESKQRGFIKVSLLQDQMRASYKYLGSEGTRYKKYVSACHGMLNFHNVVTNEIILEHAMTKKKMRLVAFDHFIAHYVLKERRIVYGDRKKDLRSVLQEFYALKIQRRWRTEKEVSKTRLKLLLNR